MVQASVKLKHLQTQNLIMMNYEDQCKCLSEGYWKFWNNEEQARIDADIEKYRKTDANIAIGAPKGAKIKIEQLTHEFVFGAHLFNFNQLGSCERNDRYKSLYGFDKDNGAIFNSATIAFYWTCYEPKEGTLRFDPAPEDSEEWWNSCPNPEYQPHWRRPPVEPCVAFAEEKGIRRHGHPLVWSNHSWHYPTWLMSKLPHEILAEMLTDDRSPRSVLKQSLPELAARLPKDFIRLLGQLDEKRIREIAERYGNRFHSWDVCNESARDFASGALDPSLEVTRSFTNTFMQADYCHKAFQTAMKYMPSAAKLNINDYFLQKAYKDQVENMLTRGDKIDIMGLQRHLFNPSQCQKLADGADSYTPAEFRAIMDKIRIPGMPTHLSEITITAPQLDETGEAIQAIITRNLYRLWFSTPEMMGITWWNVVDGCGAPGEPSYSGLFHRDMTPKQSYFALNDLINKEWRTNLELTADDNGAISFRGFRGRYRFSWTDASGKAVQTERDIH